MGSTGIRSTGRRSSSWGIGGERWFRPGRARARQSGEQERAMKGQRSGLKEALAISVLVLLAAALIPVSSAAPSGGSAIRLVTHEVVLGKVDPDPEARTVRPDRWRVAFVRQRGDKEVVVVDGVEGSKYDSIAEGSLVFSPDGKRVAYVAARGDKWVVVVDGREGKEYDGYSDNGGAY